MNRWQNLAETNPSASPEQQTLLGLLVMAELENSGSRHIADQEPPFADAGRLAPPPLLRDRTALGGVPVASVLRQ